MKFRIRRKIRVRNESDSIITYHGVKFRPGEVHMVNTDYVMISNKKLTTMNPNLVVMETLPDLVEEKEPVENRWELLDI